MLPLQEFWGALAPQTEVQLSVHAVCHWCRHQWQKTSMGWVHSTKLPVSYGFYRRSFRRVKMFLSHNTKHGDVSFKLGQDLACFQNTSWGRQKIPRGNTCWKLWGFSLATGDCKPCEDKFLIFLTCAARLYWSELQVAKNFQESTNNLHLQPWGILTVPSCFHRKGKTDFHLLHPSSLAPASSSLILQKK